MCMLTGVDGGTTWPRRTINLKTVLFSNYIIIAHMCVAVPDGTLHSSFPLLLPLIDQSSTRLDRTARDSRARMELPLEADEVLLAAGVSAIKSIWICCCATSFLTASNTRPSRSA